MPVAGAAARRGRRGRRTGAMTRIAAERVRDLFALAESESQGGPTSRANRYVALARRIGTRYNVRVPRELAERYCRACSSYWVEGRTVRTRLRGGRRVRTCLVCGRIRRSRWDAEPLVGAGSPLPEGRPPPRESSVALVDDDLDGEDDELDEDGSDE